MTLAECCARARQVAPATLSQRASRPRPWPERRATGNVPIRSASRRGSRTTGRSASSGRSPSGRTRRGRSSRPRPATTKQSAATVEYLDGSNSTLTDADSTADGFQVPLSVGRNTVKVKVTASDTTTTKTYTVTIFRTTATVTSCSANAMVNQVWTGQLVAEPGGSLVGYSESSNVGTLSDTTFSYNGNTHNIQSIRVFPGAHLSILLDAGLGTDTSDLTLHVGTQEYAFDDAISQTTGGYSWTSNPPSWSDADAICLALTEVDDTPPTLTGISTRQNNSVALGYDETIDNTSVPDKSAFEVKVGGVARTVSSISLGTAGVSLRLGSAFRPGDALTFSYTVPGTGPIQDAAGNEAAGFTDEAVDNTLPATAPDAPRQPRGKSRRRRLDSPQLGDPLGERRRHHEVPGALHHRQQPRRHLR